MKALTNYINRRFRDPVVFAEVARRLREGASMIKVEYRNRWEARYYTGSGNLINTRSGERKRWMVAVHRFSVNNLHEDGLSRFKFLGSSWMNQEELDLLLDWNMDNVSSITEVYSSAVSNETIKTELVDIVRRLKPGQGYNHNGLKIETDLINADGLVLRGCGQAGVIPEANLNSQLFGIPYVPGEPFDTANVYVADEDVIKRQHRPNTDLRRWVVVKELPSAEDKWAIRYTHSCTAGARIVYHSVDINIDNKAMKGHPFYITELVNDALDQISAKFKNGAYVLDQTNVTITWNGETQSLLAWMDHVKKFPASLDQQPNVIYNKLESVARYSPFDGHRFEVA